jgi:hypothetical protein
VTPIRRPSRVDSLEREIGALTALLVEANETIAFLHDRHSRALAEKRRLSGLLYELGVPHAADVPPLDDTTIGYIAKLRATLAAHPYFVAMDKDVTADCVTIIREVVTHLETVEERHSAALASANADALNQRQEAARTARLLEHAHLLLADLEGQIIGPCQKCAHPNHGGVPCPAVIVERGSSEQRYRCDCQRPESIQRAAGERGS